MESEVDNGLAARAKVTAADIETYRRDGAVLVKGVLDADALLLLRSGIEEAYRQQSSRTTKVEAESGAGETLVLDYSSQQSPSLRALLDNGVIGKIGAALMQTPSAHLILDQIFHKSRARSSPLRGIRIPHSCACAATI